MYDDGKAVRKADATLSFGDTSASADLQDRRVAALPMPCIHSSWAGQHSSSLPRLMSAARHVPLNLLPYAAFAGCGDARISHNTLVVTWKRRFIGKRIFEQHMMH